MRFDYRMLGRFVALVLGIQQRPAGNAYAFHQERGAAFTVWQWLFIGLSSVDFIGRWARGQACGLVI